MGLGPEPQNPPGIGIGHHPIGTLIGRVVHDREQGRTFHRGIHGRAEPDDASNLTGGQGQIGPISFCRGHGGIQDGVVPCPTRPAGVATASCPRTERHQSQGLQGSGKALNHLHIRQDHNGRPPGQQGSGQGPGCQVFGAAWPRPYIGKKGGEPIGLQGLVKLLKTVVIPIQVGPCIGCSPVQPSHPVSVGGQPGLTWNQLLLLVYPCHPGGYGQAEDIGLCTPIGPRYQGDVFPHGVRDQGVGGDDTLQVAKGRLGNLTGRLPPPDHPVD